MAEEIKYDIIIFDVDDTLLNYSKSETNAFYNTMSEIGVNCNNDLIKTFENICNEEWNKKGLNNTKDENVQYRYHTLYSEYDINRFKRLKEIMDIDITANRLSEIYLDNFSNECTQIDDALMVCETLSSLSKLVIATNSLSKVQHRRLRDFRDLFCNFFISEEINCIKPSLRFFNLLIEELAIDDLSRILMVGDSLISDIYGASKVGIDTCWFNNKCKDNNTGIKSTYEIQNLKELLTNIIYNRY